MSDRYRVKMTHITKSFMGVHALSDVSFKVKSGEIHALVGENGAGKSTLMKILAGAYQKDGGTIDIDGDPVDIINPYMGRKLGIAIIYQEFALVPDLTVAENIFLDHLSSRQGFIKWSDLYQKSGELIHSIGFDIDPRAIVGELSVAYQQVVEITKALSEEAKILILDEPTAVLAPHEVDRLIDILKKLKEKQVSIIYISHRLDEVIRLADKITVIKDGFVTGTVSAGEVNTDDIIKMMIGRKLTTLFPKRTSQIGKEIFKVEGLQRGNTVNNVSFSVRSGEVFGIAGLVGSGRSETVRAIFSADSKDSGNIELDGQLLKIRSPRDAVRSGIGFVPEDRTEQGVILSMTIRENVTMPALKKVRNPVGFIKNKDEKKITRQLIQELVIKTRSSEEKVSNLSGGNQQKVVLAKWFSSDFKVIILDEPTRGVDVGAKVEIYSLINQLAEAGLGVIIISSELIEIMGICDRVAVMRKGQIQRILQKDELSEEKIMRLAIA